MEGVAEYGVKKDAWVQARFPTVTTTAVGIEPQLRDGYSAGLLEWRVIEE